MCRIMVDTKKLNKSFVLENILYKKNNQIITKEQILRDFTPKIDNIKSYDFDGKIQKYVDDGVLIVKDKGYKVCMR